MRTVDLSHWQAVTDWNALLAAADAVLLKGTGGTSYVDPTLGDRLGRLRAAGKPRGTYHFAGNLGSDSKYHCADPAAEAAHYLSAVGHQPGEWLVLDYEPTAPPPDPDGWCAAFLTAVTGTGAPVPVTYMNSGTARTGTWARTRATGTGLWVAQYGANNGQPGPAPAVGSWGGYAMWQFTSLGSVPGVSGGVDVSTFDGDTAAWGRYGAATGANPPPPPPPFDPNSLPTLTEGARNDPRVARWQAWSNAYEWRPPLPLLPVTGNYLDQTVAVVKAAQAQCDITGPDANGTVIGPRSKAAFAARGARW